MTHRDRSADDPSSLDPESVAVGAGDDHAAGTHDVVHPIHTSSTYGLETAGYPDEGYTYARHGNPTRARLESRLADLTGATDVVAAASGMAAIATTCLSVLSPGDRLLAGDSLFGGTKTLFDDFLEQWGVDVAYVDATDTAAVERAVDRETSLVWLESPTNPLLHVPDITGVADVADDADATLAVDNTFATPVGQRPLDLGADVAVCSATKFLNGHSDSVGGAVATTDPDLAETAGFVLEDLLGAPLAPFDSYLVARGIKTLPARMAAHEHRATRIAEFLADHDAVADVAYPGLTDHPHHERAREQLDNFGGVVTVELDASEAETRAVVEDLDVFDLAMSLGGVESLVEHTPSMSAASLSADERAAAGIPDTLVRLSVGLESVDDLRGDLAASLAKIEN